MIIYLLLVNIAIILSYSLYYFSFRKLTFFQWNRVYLLSTALLALLIPIGLFIDLSSFLEDDVIIPMLDMNDYVEIPIVVNAQQSSSLYLVDMLKWVYVVGLVVSASLLFRRLWQVHGMFQSDAPFLGFSFFNKMFLGREIQHYQSIEHHEQIHINQGHSYDVLFMEVFKALNWFNPVAHSMAKEIKFQHECIADELSSEDKVAYAELLVAHAMKVPKNVLVHEFSNQSFLKKRIMMLFKNKSSNNKRFLYLGIIPAFLIVGLSTVIFNTSRAKSVVAKVESKIEDMNTPLSQEINTARIEQFLAQVEKSSLVNIQDTIKEGGNEIFTQTEINPEPPGGMDKFRKWIGKNYQYPQEAIDAGVKGIILTSFVIEKDGSLSNLKVLKDLSHNTGQRAIELLKRSPKWSPAIQNGRKVRYSFEFPIRIDLSQTGVDTKETTILPIAQPKLGYIGLRRWLNEVYQLPRAIERNDEDPVVKVSFDVNPDGTFGNSFTGQSDLGPSFTAELIKHVKKSVWEPAEGDGVKQKSRGYLYIKFNSQGKIIEDYTRIEIIPEPKGGMVAFRKYLGTNYGYPDELLANKQHGNVEVQFEISADGNPTNMKILKESHKGIGQELESLIKKYGTWLPGIVDGKKMRSAYKLKVNFKFIEGAGGTIDVGNLQSLGFIKS